MWLCCICIAVAMPQISAAESEVSSSQNPKRETEVRAPHPFTLVVILE